MNRYHNNNVEIILLDASKQGRGGLAGGYRSKNDRPVEAGIHGFLREYRNTFDVMSMIEDVEVDVQSFEEWQSCRCTCVVAGRRGWRLQK